MEAAQRQCTAGAPQHAAPALPCVPQCDSRASQQDSSAVQEQVYVHAYVAVLFGG